MHNSIYQNWALKMLCGHWKDPGMIIALQECPLDWNHCDVWEKPELNWCTLWANVIFRLAKLETVSKLAHVSWDHLVAAGGRWKLYLVSWSKKWVLPSSARKYSKSCSFAVLKSKVNFPCIPKRSFSYPSTAVCFRERGKFAVFKWEDPFFP